MSLASRVARFKVPAALEVCLQDGHEDPPVLTLRHVAQLVLSHRRADRPQDTGPEVCLKR